MVGLQPEQRLPLPLGQRVEVGLGLAQLSLGLLPLSAMLGPQAILCIDRRAQLCLGRVHAFGCALRRLRIISAGQPLRGLGVGQLDPRGVDRVLALGLVALMLGLLRINLPLRSIPQPQQLCALTRLRIHKRRPLSALRGEQRL